MKNIMLQVEFDLNIPPKVQIYDCSFNMSQSRWKQQKYKIGEVYEFVGKEFTVYVWDTFAEIGEDNCKKVAIAWVNGDYDVYNYSTDKTTKGKRLTDDKEKR